MNMSDWAREEVRIACEHEAPGKSVSECDYGCACYQSALKAYLLLMEDEHSGMSFHFTAEILKRLMAGRPLTAIDDVPDVWDMIPYSRGDERDYQCKRMSSLFKHVAEDGTVTYSDNGRYTCHEVGSGWTYQCGIESGILDELHPITMPYYPPAGIYVFTTRELLTDRRNGDFDTKAVLTLKTPDGKIEEVNRFYAESENGWREISFEEFKAREAADKIRQEMEDNNDAE